ncbi:MAG: hypothetical protein HY053_05775 [Proteobacteria bacterium]|nr:hypothetical protein [Pseudomonadota bacterium]
MFLFFQLSPSCYSYTGRAQTEEHCICKGYELARSHGAASGGTSRSTCVGWISDRYVNFVYWLPDGLGHGDRLTLVKDENGAKTLMDTVDRKLIQHAALVFEGLNEGWQLLKSPTPMPTYAITFYKYVPRTADTNQKEEEAWFGIGPGFLELKSGRIRALNPEEEAKIKNLVGE